MTTRSRKLLLTTPAVIEQVTGPDKGKMFELASDKITIGRAENNDIIVEGEGISRQHAMMIKNDGAWFIRDNQSKNGLMINGRAAKEGWLANGDVVQIGSFVFRFSDSEDNAGAAVENAAAEEPIANDFTNVTGISEAPAKKAGPNKRLLIYGGAALVVVFALMSGGEDKPKEGAATPGSETAEVGKLARDFTTGKEPSMDIASNKQPVVGLEDPILKRAEQDMAKLDWSNSSLRESEQFFRKGQREYMNHAYHRAIESFQTALSLYRGHVLAERYLRRSIYEVEIEAKKNMGLGVQYFEALQYQRAIYHFTECISLMSHRPNEPITAEAERYIQQATKRLRAAELFP